MCDFEENYNPTDMTYEKALELLNIEICDDCFNENENVFYRNKCAYCGNYECNCKEISEKKSGVSK